MPANQPKSRLTRSRPDIWRRAITMAEGLTGYRFVPKLARPDGTMYACGGGGQSTGYGRPFSRKPGSPPVWYNYDKYQYEYYPETDAEKEERLKDIARRQEWAEQQTRNDVEKERQEKLEKEREEWEKEERHQEWLKRRKQNTVAVPEGNVEWVLHEVGHWLAASPAERLLPNYGLTQLEWGRNAEMELAAWAFEDAVLSPLGPTRSFVPPTCRDGLGFRPGPLATSRRVELEVARLMDLEAWRALAAEWVEWGKAQGACAPWARET